MSGPFLQGIPAFGADTRIEELTLIRRERGIGMLDEGTFITLLRAVDKSNHVNSDRMFFATERAGAGEGTGRVVGVGDLDVGDLDVAHFSLLYY